MTAISTPRGSMLDLYQQIRPVKMDGIYSLNFLTT
jgi:hypothetical protein